MSSDWIHCNSCQSIPSKNVQFMFSSCGHIVCMTCLSKIPNAASCPYCKKNAKFMEINRSLKPEMQMYFRNPRDLANEYMKNLATVLDFQHSHRSRLARAQQEKSNKMMTFATAAQGEIKKRIDSEKRAITECKEVRSENEKLKMHNEQLEALLAARELEIARLRNNPKYSSSPCAAVRSEYQRSDSGLGDTPMTSLSFIDAITSTPITRGESPSTAYGARKTSRDRLKQMFQSSNGTIPSPIVRDQLVTPAMLGFNKRSSSENNRRTPSDANFMFDVNMDTGGF